KHPRTGGARDRRRRADMRRAGTTGPRAPLNAPARGFHTRRRWMPAAFAALAMVVLVVVLVRMIVPSHPATRAPADPAASLDLQAALARALELGRRGRHVASLPYFRRVADLTPGWIGLWDYAAAMNNASVEVWNRHGVLAPAS